MPERKNPTPPVRPEIAPRRMDIPGMKPHEVAHGLPSLSEGKKLIVGRDICLNGEITACDRLIVEGRVKASLTESEYIEIAATGVFKGSAEVDVAEISGCFEGKLTVRKRLVIHSTGRVSGEIRYNQIEIESGGALSGDVRTLEEEAATEAGRGVQTAPGESASLSPTLV
jgi:cytoskeletal protein CcmA (bactofilin family)